MIYHLTSSEKWLTALDIGIYKYDNTEKMIHCSVEEEVIPTANIHFPTERELIVLAIIDKKMKDKVKWEAVAAREGKLFPHIYGHVPLEVIDTTYMLKKNKEDTWVWIK